MRYANVSLTAVCAATLIVTIAACGSQTAPSASFAGCRFHAFQRLVGDAW